MKHLLLTTIAAVVLGTTAFAGPIHDAASDGNIEAVKQHLDAGSDVNAKDDLTGSTPLHYAAMGGHKELAELLIAKGANMNAKEGISGRTPLHFAAFLGQKQTAELLIVNGADVNVTISFFGTPLDRAKGEPWDSAKTQADKKEIADLLRKHGGKTSAELALMPRLVQHGRFAFSFDAKKGKVYEVHDSFDLLNWEVIKTYTGTGVSIRFDEERDHDPPKWFYRVRVVE